MNSQEILPATRGGLSLMAAIVLSCTTVLAQQVPPETPRRLKGMAEQFERDGHKKEAAEVYERLLVKDPSSRNVVAPHLVKLYVETRQPRQALKWAREYMDTTPDPQAYLAGVYARIGGYNEAKSILGKEIAAAKAHSMRAVTLRWQLAELLKKTGEVEAARTVLKEAAALAGEKPEGRVAQRRLKSFEKAHPAPVETVSPEEERP